MTDQSPSIPKKRLAERIISRFAHVISAQGVDSLLGGLFFIYVARWDSTVYGEVMYAVAVGLIVIKIVQFGLYYPLIYELTESGPEQAAKTIRAVNAIKLVLFSACMAGVGLLALLKEFSPRMGGIVFLVSLGFGLEAIAETFFADLRVKGRQKVEARIKIVAALLAYSIAILTPLLRLPTALIGCFKAVSGSARLALTGFGRRSPGVAPVLAAPDWETVKRIFLASALFGAFHILGMASSWLNVFFLEHSRGVEGVALYSAAWTLVDAVSALVSEQLLAWVIFPLLSAMWTNNREDVAPLVRRTSQWLLALALPMVFLAYTESDLVVRLIYGSGYEDTAWALRYVSWTLVASFQWNLFLFMMIVAGAGEVLLGFAVATLLTSLAANVLLVGPFGLAGACAVIIITKGLTAVLTMSYCQLKFRVFKVTDFGFLAAITLACLGFFEVSLPWLTLQPAVVLTIGLYLFLLWKPGGRFLGRPPGRRA